MNTVGAHQVLPLRPTPRLSFCMVASRGRLKPRGSSVTAGNHSSLRASAYFLPPGPKLSPCLTPGSPDLGGSSGPLPCTERSLLPTNIPPTSPFSWHCAKRDDLMAKGDDQGWTRPVTSRGSIVPPRPGRDAEAGPMLPDKRVTVLNICIGSCREEGECACPSKEEKYHLRPKEGDVVELSRGLR